MIKDELEHLISSNFPFSVTEGQKKVIHHIAEFLFSGQRDGVFLLKGYAGTGKTSLVSALVKTLIQLRRKVVLMAPTGRAAKVFSLTSGQRAYTIHKKIYRQRSFSNSTENFERGVNLNRKTFFIVDEASMISATQGGFAMGALLEDLVHYVYSSEGCRLMLIGDTAQLPPVGEDFSPALSAAVLSSLGLDVWEISLTEVVRQQKESGILWNATQLRHLIADDEYFDLPRVRFNGFPDIKILPGDELIEALEQSYHYCGTDQTIVITRSNKRANIYNNGIRNRILGREEELSGGDMLMIAKNNYYWSEKSKSDAFDFIANGEIAMVRRFRRERFLYGFRFADVLLQFPDYDDYEMEVTVLLDTLQTDAPSLTKEQSDLLFAAVEEDYADVTVKRERMKKIKEDPYYNALQVKYAYAVTCHKAQGGQWERVFLDQGYMTEDMLSPEYVRWLYTAFTRATDTLYLVNWPKEQIL